MLSVVSLAHTSKVVAYGTMKAALGMDNVRHLEDLIFDTMYSGLLQGKLDQRQEVLKVKKYKHEHIHTGTAQQYCGRHTCTAEKMRWYLRFSGLTPIPAPSDKREQTKFTS